MSLIELTDQALVAALAHMRGVSLHERLRVLANLLSAWGDPVTPEELGYRARRHLAPRSREGEVGNDQSGRNIRQPGGTAPWPQP